MDSFFQYQNGITGTFNNNNRFCIFTEFRKNRVALQGRNPQRVVGEQNCRAKERKSK